MPMNTFSASLTQGIPIPGPPMQVQDDGVALIQRQVINFVGAGVTAADNPTTLTTDVTIPWSPAQSQTPWVVNQNAASFTLTNLGRLAIGSTTPGVPAKLSLGGMPTSPSGLNPGDVWVDTANSNVLKIV